MPEFPPVSPSEWDAAIRRDLGEDAYRKLMERTEEGIPLKPFYTLEDLEALGGLPDLQRNAEPCREAQDRVAPPESGATAARQLGQAIAEAVDKLSSGAEIQLAFTVGPNYFLEIAKLRAARVVCSALRVNVAPRIHVQTAPANLIGATIEAMAAVIGGCDSLTIVPDGFDARIALNIQRILREEVHLADVADPAKGSYYVEVLTDTLAREAWKILQHSKPEFHDVPFAPPRHSAPIESHEYAAGYRAVPARPVLDDVRDAAVDHPAVRGLLDGRRIERVLPAQSRGGTEGPLGGVRPGDASRLRFGQRARGRAMSARRAWRSIRSRT